MSREEKDKKNKQAGIFISLGTHIAVILLFIFLVAWRAPNPPLPEFGIELNFGTSDQGTGDIQPETTPAEAEQEEDALPDMPEEVAEETVEETIETPVEETTEDVDEITEATEAVEEEIVPATEQETEAAVEEPEKKPEEKKEDQKLPRSYPKKEDGTAKDATKPNQGDNTDAQGDQGDEKGKIDARSLRGNQGGGDGGPELNLAGWMWDSEPRPEHDNVKFDGKITFDFQIDEKGQVISIITIPPSTVRTSLIQLYRDELEKATFYQTGSGTALPMTKGRVTFIIKAK